MKPTLTDQELRSIMESDGIPTESKPPVVGSAIGSEIPLEDVIQAVIVPMYLSRQYGTPGCLIGARCKICGAEAEIGKELKHDTSCLLQPYETQLLSPND